MNTEQTKLTITRVDIPFWDLVRLFVKAALASVPAMIIVTAIVFGMLVLLAPVMLALGAR